MVSGTNLANCTQKDLKRATTRNANLISLISVFLFFLLDLSSAKRKFADSLNEFKFQCIGDAETDDEMCIGKS